MLKLSDNQRKALEFYIYVSPLHVEIPKIFYKEGELDNSVPIMYIKTIKGHFDLTEKEHKIILRGEKIFNKIYNEFILINKYLDREKLLVVLTDTN